MKTQFFTSVDKVESLAKTLAEHLSGGEVLALTGPLGSGKTTFVQALAKELGIHKRVASPTFTLAQSFQTKNKIQLYHLDLYRLPAASAAKGLGLEEFMGKPNTITVIEWAGRIRKQLPKNTLYINFRHLKTQHEKRI